jgi:hypothetical protein
MKIILMTFIMLGLSPFLQAQEKKDRQIEINFEDELIRGDIKKPELFYLLQRKQFNFRRMINLRDDFIPEMKSTGKRIQAGGIE